MDRAPKLSAEDEAQLDMLASTIADRIAQRLAEQVIAEWLLALEPINEKLDWLCESFEGEQDAPQKDLDGNPLRPDRPEGETL